jgi:sugar/nucleoside kinase (ribokinase family)
MTTCVVDTFIYKNMECIGGNSLNVTTQCRRSGVEDVAIIGAVGDDRPGRLIEAYFERVGIDASHLHRIAGGRTSTNRIDIDENGERFFVPGAFDTGVRATFRLSDEDWAFANTFDVVATTESEPNYEGALGRLNASTKLVVDIHQMHNLSIMAGHAKRIDLGIISGGEEQLEQAREIVRNHGAFIIVTLGAEGSVALRPGEEVHQPALLVDEVVDTTGCGDAFLGAFIAAYYGGADVQSALLKGAEAGAETLGRVGAVEGGCSGG